jgi:hypothetical protein
MTVWLDDIEFRDSTFVSPIGLRVPLTIQERDALVRIARAAEHVAMHSLRRIPSEDFAELRAALDRHTQGDVT